MECFDSNEFFVISALVIAFSFWLGKALEQAKRTLDRK